MRTPSRPRRVHTDQRRENLLGFEEVVVKGVHVNIDGSGSSRQEAGPLPRKDTTLFTPEAGERERYRYSGDTHHL